MNKLIKRLVERFTESDYPTDTAWWQHSGPVIKKPKGYVELVKHKQMNIKHRIQVLRLRAKSDTSWWKDTARYEYMDREYERWHKWKDPPQYNAKWEMTCHIFRGLKGILVLNYAMLILGSSFIIYPKIIDFTNTIINNGGGNEITAYLPAWYLLSGVILAIWVYFKAIRIIRDGGNR